MLNTIGATFSKYFWKFKHLVRKEKIQHPYLYLHLQHSAVT